MKKPPKSGCKPAKMSTTPGSFRYTKVDPGPSKKTPATKQ